jgi:selenocysteine lyase/cysteine desulfurase
MLSKSRQVLKFPGLKIYKQKASLILISKKSESTNWKGVEIKSCNPNVSSVNLSYSKNELGKNTLFLDFQSTTPLDPRVLDSMMPYMTFRFGNPHSKSHEYGWDAEKAVENAREKIAKLIGADSKEIIFTSGATESNNMAIKGVAEFYKEKKKHIITTQTVKYIIN